MPNLKLLSAIQPCVLSGGPDSNTWGPRPDDTWHLTNTWLTPDNTWGPNQGVFVMRGGARFDPRTCLKIPFLAPERPRSRSSKLLKSFGSKFMSYTQVLLLHLNALMLVIILRLTFIVVVFNIVKVLSEALRKKSTTCARHGMAW